jgi:thiamine pyrophosphokinase
LRAVIIANGELKNPDHVKSMILSDDLIIAADGGTQHCLSMDLTPAMVIGDLDSSSSEKLEHLAANGVQLRRHSARKDETDLELAMLYAAERGIKEILIFAALGNRWDHSLTNLLLTAHPKLQAVAVTLIDGSQRIHLIRGNSAIEGKPGDTVSLIPIGSDAHGVTTTGLEYVLNEGVLPFGTSFGVSNVMTHAIAEVRIREGLVLCVHDSQIRDTRAT